MRKDFGLSFALIEAAGEGYKPRSACWPPSSSGLGRGPLKAKTGVRLPLGAPRIFHIRDRGEAMSDIMPEMRG